MQKFISQIPELAHFLSQTHKKQHYKIVRQLILLGINAAQNRCHQQKHKMCDNLVTQISRIKQNLYQLNHFVKSQCPPTYGYIYNPAPAPKSSLHDHQYNNYPEKCSNPQLNYANTQRIHSQPAQKDYLQQKRTSGPKILQKKSKNHSKDEKASAYNPFLKEKTKFRHHLDDTQARQVLNYPADLLVQVHHPIKRKSKDYKKHIYQEEINKQEMMKNKYHEEEEQHHDFTRRNRSQTDYHKAQSKIKSLLDKDRLRFMQKQRDQSFKEGFNKYQYSDQNQMQQQSSFSQEVKQINQSNKYDISQSNFKQSNKASSSHKSKGSSKKGIQRSKNQVVSQVQVSYADNEPKYDQNSKKSGEKDINIPLRMRQTEKEGKLYRSKQKEEQEQEQEQDSSNDMISDSSSFSQFSINGSRRKQIGKISRRKQDN